jgi:hypothetical protein
LNPQRVRRYISGSTACDKGDPAMRRGRLLTVAALVAFCMSAGTSLGQDEPPGAALDFEVNAGTGYNCGRVSSPLYCYGIPVNIGPATGGNGSFWIDTYVSGPNAGRGFILFNGVADLGQATVTGNQPTLNDAGQVGGLTVEFRGMTNDGDGDTYTGTINLTFSYYYSRGGGGKGGGGAGWRFICTGGSAHVQYYPSYTH